MATSKCTGNIIFELESNNLNCTKLKRPLFQSTFEHISIRLSGGTAARTKYMFSRSYPASLASISDDKITCLNQIYNTR